jgi:hypothetical protein
MKRTIRLTIMAGALACLGLAALPQFGGREEEEGAKVRCANLVYAVNKSSVCFSDRFLRRLELETNIRTDTSFVPVRLDSNELYQYPFAIMTGEGGFALTPRERIALKYYVSNGGFLLASAGCSDTAWARSFRDEMSRIFPQRKMTVISAKHAIYRTVYVINTAATTHSRQGAQLEGLTLNGKLVVLFSRDGLNDTSHAKNCCCCGGDEVGQAEYINANVLAYALMQ